MDYYLIRVGKLWVNQYWKNLDSIMLKKDKKDADKFDFVSMKSAKESLERLDISFKIVEVTVIEVEKEHAITK